MIPPGTWPTAATTLARTFGLRGSMLRAAHEIRRRSGRFRAQPRFRAASSDPIAHPFSVEARSLAEATSRSVAIGRADRVVAGEYEAYRWDWRPFPTDADGWLRNIGTGFRYPRDAHWWKVSHDDAAAGDIKDVWEPARFGWAYDLVRGYLLTGHDRYARAFHDRLAQWCDSSPPFRGVHWSCGQETAIRATALLYAEANLADAASTTPQAKERLRDLLAASGERIGDALGYAISQRNNHAISEAAGLIALGVRFAGAHPEARRWLDRGQRCLARVIPEQFAEDGWYIQHSFNYLRLALDQCVVARRSLASVGESLPMRAVGRLAASVDLLCAVIDRDTGIVPNHGANDGAFVHPITLAEYRDARPAITAVCASFGLPVPVDLPVDAESLAWLGLRAPAAGPPLADGVMSGGSGWAAARVGATAVFLRAGRYRSRPSHLDPLHMDVRMGGHEVIVDPGTYAYRASPPWNNALVSARVHNGPLLDDAEPGIRGPRFLWFAWPSADILSARFAGDVATLVAEIPGKVRRTVTVTSDEVVVEDEVLSPTARRMAVRWLPHPASDADPVTGTGTGTGTVRTIEATADSPYGWFSPRYGERIRSRLIIVEQAAHRGARIVCRIGAPSPVAETTELAEVDRIQ